MEDSFSLLILSTFDANLFYQYFDFQFQFTCIEFSLSFFRITISKTIRISIDYSLRLTALCDDNVDFIVNGNQSTTAIWQLAHNDNVPLTKEKHYNFISSFDHHVNAVCKHSIWTNCFQTHTQIVIACSFDFISIILPIEWYIRHTNKKLYTHTQLENKTKLAQAVQCTHSALIVRACLWLVLFFFY